MSIINDSFPVVKKVYQLDGEGLSPSDGTAGEVFDGEQGTLSLEIELVEEWNRLCCTVEIRNVSSGRSDAGGIQAEGRLTYTVPAALMSEGQLVFHVRGTDLQTVKKSGEQSVRISPSFNAVGELPEPETGLYEDLLASVGGISQRCGELEDTCSGFSEEMSLAGENAQRVLEGIGEAESIMDSARDMQTAQTLIFSALMKSLGVTSLANMFEESSIAAFPPLDLSAVTSLAYAFRNSALESLPDLSLDACTSMYECFNGCTELISVGALNTPLCQKMYALFRNCRKLESVGSIDMSCVNSCNQMFTGCTSLTEIRFAGIIPLSLDLRMCVGLSAQSLESVIGALDPNASGQTITLGAANIAKLTEEQTAAIAAKGWTLA